MDGTAFKVIVMAIVQGVTEMLPVSSSGHLVLAKRLLGLDAPGATLEVALHAGTLGSILLYYRMRILALIRGLWGGDAGGTWRYAAALALGCAPAAVAGVLFKDRIECLFDSPRLAGGFLLVTGALLLVSRLARPRGDGEVTPLRGLLVGCVQAFALLPGISRSGSTIAAARLAGVAPAKAAEYSFLMALPLLAGAVLLSAGEMVHEGAGAVSPGLLALGAAVAGLVGYAAIGVVVRCLAAGRFWLFGFYCLGAGALAVWLG